MFLAATVTGVAGYLSSSGQTPLYRAGATVLVQQSQSIVPTLSDIQTSQHLART